MRLKITDKNSYRRATRDLLLEYDSDIMPPHFRVAAPDETYASLPMPSTLTMQMVYPWEQILESDET